jgi:diguanylate cyclase (GGDEF)-like protein
MSGDKLLREATFAIRAVLRSSDVIARQGGDEFAIFCRGIKDNDSAMKKATQIKEAFEDIIPEGGTKPITVSIGIAFFPKHGVTFNELYNNADTALYKAKFNGKNRCEIFDDGF